MVVVILRNLLGRHPLRTVAMTHVLGDGFRTPKVVFASYCIFTDVCFPPRARSRYKNSNIYASREISPLYGF